MHANDPPVQMKPLSQKPCPPSWLCLVMTVFLFCFFFIVFQKFVPYVFFFHFFFFFFKVGRDCWRVGTKSTFVSKKIQLDTSAKFFVRLPGGVFCPASLQFLQCRLLSQGPVQASGPRGQRRGPVMSTVFRVTGYSQREFW